MSADATPEPAKDPAIKPGDKVTVPATIIQANGPNWILKLSNGTHTIFEPGQFTKQP